MKTKTVSEVYAYEGTSGHFYYDMVKVSKGVTTLTRIDEIAKVEDGLFPFALGLSNGTWKHVEADYAIQEST